VTPLGPLPLPPKGRVAEEPEEGEGKMLVHSERRMIVLKITKSGRARVATLEFAEELEEFVTNAKEGFVAGSDGLPISEKVG
jgi:hypothetical protein